MDALTDHEVEVLQFAALRWNYAGAREQAIKDLFDLSSHRYGQQLNALLDRPEALVHSPMLVKRLRRERERKQAQRSARKLQAQQ